MADILTALGVDIDLTSGDLAFGPGGDLAQVAGPALVQQKVYLACIDLLQASLQVPFTLQSQARLEQQCQERMQALPEVAVAGAVTASMHGSAELDVETTLTLAGGLVLPVTVSASAIGSPPVITTGLGG